ncbi:enoyl-CoA hydratase/isomerase family protein [Pararhodobacter sp. CCB-MM2]|uniref:enoyl-CoA hydratase/isomerase family protein n=1 Tax=Pararhodobacter sp. CCB-MM2 TaxID=1786003 RepID=UPI0008299B30|nr:enoyl-CoA hydratase-related protein [Pararhodobacter sp. CCB-MM2]MCA2013670.1 enoyl-CoA hydratase/isomerase family protein [Cereibacter sphaeroides]
MSNVLTDFDPATGIGRLTLNRPEVLNALDAATAQDFLTAVRALTTKPGLRCIVLTGAGRAFAAGGDVATFTANGIERAPEVIHALLDPLNTAIIALRQHPAPVITAVKGVAAGAGLSLALSGDLILAEEKARFVVAYDRVGAPPDCGMSWFLPRRVGRGMAFEMMLTGRVITAPEALACRLVDRTAHAEAFDTELEALALRVASGPTQAYGHFKALMDSDMGLAEHLEAERAAFIRTTATADFAEGVAAFTGKRDPKFQGA